MKKELNVVYVAQKESLVNLIKDYIETSTTHINLHGFNSTDDALDHISQSTVDCILADNEINSERHNIENGIDLVNHLRSENHRIPYIQLCQKNIREISQEAIAAGATDAILHSDIIETSDILINRIENAYKTEESKNRLKKISSIATRLATTTNVNTIGEICIEAAGEIMGYEFVGFHLKEEDKLIPIEYTDRVEEVLGPPVITDKNSMAWNAYNQNEVLHDEDVSTRDDVLNEETAIRSEVSIPLGKYGVLLVGSTETDGFTNADISALELIAEHTVETLRRKDKNEKLERYKLFVENSPDTIEIISTDGIVKYQNRDKQSSSKEKQKTDKKEKITKNAHPDHSERLSNALEKVTQQKDNVIRVQYKAKNELGDWRWFESQMKDYSDNDIIQGVIRTTRDITDQKNTEENLKRKNKKLDEFTDVVCHDLKNPIAAIEANLELIEYKTDNEDILKRIKDAENKTTRMEELIEDISALARVEEIDGNKEEINLKSTAKNAWETIQQKQATIDICLEDNTTVKAVESRVQQMFENLFKNAIAHGGDDVCITIDHIENGIYVKDDGEGIDQGVKDRIFKKGITTSDDGSGYGLEIVQTVTEEHGWEIEVGDSTSGAKFNITGLDTNGAGSEPTRAPQK